MKNKWPKQFFYFLVALFLINILQASFTQLIFDEAYYWHFAQEMAWGYFDHPPMVAALIKISSFLFSGELGVRFLSCLLGIGTVVLLWDTISNSDKIGYIPHFFLLIFAMPLLNAYGFLTLPDTPLLFFTAFFLWTYKKYLEGPTILLSLLLGVLMAALMYSKYHAFLVIFLVFLSNLSLIKDKYAWLALLIGIVCYTPHLYWLWENNWVSIKYHLFDRPNRAYEFMDFTLGYLLNLILIFGLIFPVVYYSIFRQRPDSMFKRCLLFLVLGFLTFFFVSSFNRRVQTQWIIIVCIPAVLLTYDFILRHSTSSKWLYKLGIASAAILLFARLGLIYEPLFPVAYETHGNKEWAQTVANVAQERPVVFVNSYRNAPMYAFYSEGTSFSLNNMMYRKNQYSIDSSEEKVRGKDVLVISKKRRYEEYEFTTGRGGTQTGMLKKNFHSYRKLEAIISAPIPRDADTLVLEVINPYPFSVNVEDLSFGMAYLNSYKQVMETHATEIILNDGELPILRAEDTLRCRILIPDPRIDTHSYLRVGISENTLFWGLNGKPTSIIP
ncbi:MAG: glycosyltransferase family 39 protein [Bacteroidia bacterium]|nr:glycosyltransferase family 39 protein [Bacteroidia bacterium]